MKDPTDAKNGSGPPDAARAAALSRMCQLVEEHWRSMLATAHGFCRDKSEAEELVHATILHVLERPMSLRHEENPGGWLAIVMARLHYGKLRRPERRYEHVSILDVHIRASDDGDPPDSTLISDDELRAAVDRLPPVLRDPLMRFIFDGIPQQQIADEMNVSPEAIRSRVHRAKEKLRALLSKGGKKK